MNEPYKSCWECKVCSSLKEHLEVCMPLQEQADIVMEAREFISNGEFVAIKDTELDKVMEANRAKLKT